MYKTTLFRLSGAALSLGAVLSAIGYGLKPVVTQDPSWYLSPLYLPSALLTFLGAVIMLIGLPGMYAFQAAEAGSLGLVSFLIAFVGLAVLEVGTGLLYAFIPPLLASKPTTQFLIIQAKGGGFEGQMGGAFLVFLLIGLLGSNFGGLLYGVATFRARVFPRVAAVLMSGGVILGLLLGALHSRAIGDRPIILMLAGFAWCGAHLLTRGQPGVLPESRGRVRNGILSDANKDAMD